ncbi:MAG: hypothetical protein DRJ63_05935 [Thermoprotei archaeon]|nr:MAG: hypothetical protein DRJ63_05935 [Thermoprotei archaeon]
MSEALKILGKKINKAKHKRRKAKSSVKHLLSAPKFSLPQINIPKLKFKVSCTTVNRPLSDYISKLKSKRSRNNRTILGKYDLVERIKEGTFAWDFSLKRVYVWPKLIKEPWFQIYPLVKHPRVKEVFMRGDEINISTPEGRFTVIFPEDNLVPEKILTSLAIYSGAQLSIAKPHSEADYDGWRLLLSLPEVSLEPELVAVKLQQIPPLTALVDRKLAARLILLSLSKTGIIITGSSGSGKTTLLNSIVNTIYELYPFLRICVIEARIELQLPRSPLISRSRGENLTQLIRDAFYLMRPDILVLGELRGQEIISWIEVCRAGIPSLTTYHSPSINKAIESLSLLLRSTIERVGLKEIPKLFDAFIKMERKVSVEGNRYAVSEVYVSNGEKYNKIYPPHISDEKFLQLIDSCIVDGDVREVYSDIMKRI